MGDVDVHELINMPGAGVAESRLREAGLWKETTEEGAPVWEVEIEYSVA